MHAPSNATEALAYASLALVEDRGMTELTALSSLAARSAPVAASTAVADAPPPLPRTRPPTTTPPTPTATLTTSFVKLNSI
jgi:hypothetical protein